MGRELKYAICDSSVPGYLVHVEFKSFGFEISRDNDLLLLTSFDQKLLRTEINELATWLKKEVDNQKFDKLEKITEAMKVYAHLLTFLNSPNQVVLLRCH